jgi:hypothetical protein
MPRFLNEDNPLGQLEAAIAADDLNLAYSLVFEMTRGGRDLGLANAATARCLNSGNRVLRSVGLRALGDIARVFDTLDESYKEVLEEGLADPDRHIRRSAEQSAMDLYSFLHWHFRNWTPQEPPEPAETRFEDLLTDHEGPVRRINDLVSEHFAKSHSQNDLWRMAIGLPPLDGRSQQGKPAGGQ